MNIKEENMAELYSHNMTEQKKMNQENSANAPVEKFKAGQIVASIWKQKRKEGQDYDTFSVSVEKNYKDKEGNWKKTSSFQVNELPKVELVCNKAYDYLLTNNGA